jgi:glyoxylase-like metal-dependent hydrolase (beta-lactamase superfamily II)
MANTGEGEQARDAPHTTWQLLTHVINVATPFFEKFLFMPGYGNLASNIYLIMGDYLTIVDPGNDYTAFMELWERNLEPANVKKVVITHGHPDHAMGTFELLRSYPSVSGSGGFEFVLHAAGPAELKKVAKELGARVTEVRGGETLDLSGLAWEVIYTPGHTIDGICLYHAPTKTAMTGDMVLPDAMAEPDASAGGRLDYYLVGLKALLKRDIENVLPGHGFPVASAGRKVIEDTYEGVMMKIIGLAPPIPWMQGAVVLAQRGLFEEALFCCDKEVARSPGDLRALGLKASCLTDLGRFSESGDIFDQILARRGDDGFALMGKGYALMGLGQYDESLQYFDRVLTIAPDTKEAQIYKGIALYLSGKYDEAMDIEAFSTEFAERVKQELQRKSQPSSQSESP